MRKRQNRGPFYIEMSFCNGAQKMNGALEVENEIARTLAVALLVPKPKILLAYPILTWHFQERGFECRNTKDSIL